MSSKNQFIPLKPNQSHVRQFYQRSANKYSPEFIKQIMTETSSRLNPNDPDDQKVLGYFERIKCDDKLRTPDLN